MSKKRVRLNLGCGIVYKPGYINVDKFDKRVADTFHDAISLPYESSSADIIEALHLLEHFDHIHAVYALSEWLRVLRPGGKLIIETPDLELSIKKFKANATVNQDSTLRWIFGTGSPGMGHGTGFSYRSLKTTLEEIGFTGVTRKEQNTHKYEPGLRVECRKPEKMDNSYIFSMFRASILKGLSDYDSEMLDSLEEHCLKQIRNDFIDRGKEIIVTAVAKLAVCSPEISMGFLDTCYEFDLIAKDEKVQIRSLIKYLMKIDFHRKLLPLWEKAKKRLGNADRDFHSFLRRLEELIKKLAGKNASFKDRLAYISNLEASDIPMFNFYYVQLQGRILFNMGVKCFELKKYSEAIELLTRSARINPENLLSYWNLARLGAIMSKEDRGISENYDKASLLVQDKRISNIFKDEMKSFKNDGKEQVPRGPLSEYSFRFL